MSAKGQGPASAVYEKLGPEGYLRWLEVKGRQGATEELGCAPRQISMFRKKAEDNKESQATNQPEQG